MTWQRPILMLVVAATALSVAPAAAAGGSIGERALELVTPAEPVTGTVQGTIGIALGGGRIAYASLGPMPGAPAGDLFANNVSSRGSDGWGSTPIGLPYGTYVPELPVALEALSQDLLTSIWTSNQPQLPSSPPAGHLGLYRRDAGGQIELLADLGANEGRYIGVSETADRVVFATGKHLLSSDTGREEGESIYESSQSGLKQVDVGHGGGLLSACGSTAGGPNGVSATGQRIFFTNPSPSTACEAAPRVYLREGGSTTVDISASHCSRLDCNAERAVTFVGATADGGSAFMVTTQQLTDDDVDERNDLYRYDVTGSGLTLVSGGGEGEVMTNPVQASDSGDRVYFRAEGELTPGKGAVSDENLYLADGAGLHFIAPTGAGDLLQISADGRIALLDTAAALSAGDTDERRDVYRYAAEDGTLTPLSFGPGYGHGPFDATLKTADSEIPGRALSDDGSQLFFSTAEPLLVADGNGALDVYEWDGGALGLVSTGAAAGAAEFAGISADGGTVVFRTAATLLPRDRDGGEFDLYAARIGGGFAEGALPAQCVPPCEAHPATPTARTAPASMRVRRHGKKARFRVRAARGSLGKALAKHGRVALAVSVPAPGLVSARMTARIGAQSRPIALGRTGAVRPGSLRVILHLTHTGRKMLTRRHSLSVRLELRQSDLRIGRRIVLEGIGR